MLLNFRAYVPVCNKRIHNQKEVYFVKNDNHPSFILELKLSAVVWQQHILKTRIEMARRLYNTTRSYALKQVQFMKESKRYRKQLYFYRETKSKKEVLFMSTHIGAKPGEIAETILLPGDPLRAKYIAENFLENIVCYNEIRNMLGFTGTYKGKRVSVQGSGMGIPSISIYATELMKDYNVQNLVRVGTCGAFEKVSRYRDVIIAMSASTDSHMNRKIFGADGLCPNS